ncbi:MAG TPA: N-acetylmuramoyl-L-alanine amidase [Streptosporangiaceae bacterium]
MRITGHAAGVAVAVSLLWLTAGCGGTPSPQAPAPDAPRSTSQHSTPAAGDSPGGSPTASPSQPGKPLAGMIVGIDPGHDGLNGSDPAYINQLIWNGRQSETCDTTGTATDAGYTEALFNFRVAMFLRADLLRDGAQVVLTRTTNQGVGPCVNRRAQIINHSHANVAIDIHADGGPASGRGFTVLEPVADGPNNQVIATSVRFGHDVRAALLAHTVMPVSNYDGVNGLTFRDDLAGLNLTRVPKILIECGNMRNATDAALLTTTLFQKQLASAFEAAIIRFLHNG